MAKAVVGIETRYRVVAISVPEGMAHTFIRGLAPLFSADAAQNSSQDERSPRKDESDDATRMQHINVTVFGGKEELFLDSVAHICDECGLPFADPRGKKRTKK